MTHPLDPSRAALVDKCELYAKIIEGIVVVPNDWQDGDVGSERREPRETLLEAAAALRALSPTLNSGAVTKAEIQSGTDRQQWAEGLILQLPENHDGRNSWLLNYGRGDVAKSKREKRGLSFNEQSQAINPPALPRAVQGGAAALATEVDGCFQAAYAEGLSERLAEADQDQGTLADLVLRRLVYAHHAAIAALSPNTGDRDTTLPQSDGTDQ